MDKRGCKLQEFVAHSANVNCLKFGKKTRRNFITGGDDEKVNLWSIGKPTATTSLSGHTSPIESVAFDKTEVFVAAGASSGVIKLWDLEETKVVRSFNGHRSYCTSLEFHPFGEFLASGSMDTNLKVWDIRKKSCIHTYKGHKRAISTIRFSPDGRWVVSGGLDNVVKIWDLTAGKLLHEFKFHEGHIRSMDFHPLEFLLATGSSDKTVKFWDLETFELIGSTRPEATGVRAITFHPDGRTLFCGLDNSLKVYSWEPVICHDGLDMGWSTLGDLCIDDGKLLGCSYYQNSVAVWVADTSLIEQHGHVLPERVVSHRRSTMSSDDDTKDIKNIYVDSVTPIASRILPTAVNLQSPIVIDNLSTVKKVPAAKLTGKVNNNSAKHSAESRRESTTNEQDRSDISLKPSHRRRPSTTKLDLEGLSITAESGLRSGPDTATVDNIQRSLPDDATKDTYKEKVPISACVTKEIQKVSTPGDRSVDSKKELKSVKYVNGVAVVNGRTRSLVERFEKREKLNTEESQTPDIPTPISTNTDMPATRVKESFVAPDLTTPVTTITDMPATRVKESFDAPNLPTPVSTNTDMPATRVKESFDAGPYAIPEAKTSRVVPSEEPEAKSSQMPVKTLDVAMVTEESEAITLTIPEKQPDTVLPCTKTETKSSPMVRKPDPASTLIVQRPKTAPSVLPEKGKASPIQRAANSRRVLPERVRASPMLVRRSNASPRITPERTKTSPVVVVPRHDTTNRITPERTKISPVVVVSRHDTPNRMVPERTKISPMMVSPRHDTPDCMVPEKAKSSPLLDDNLQTTGLGMISKKDAEDVVEDLMMNHDVFVSSLRSRLTKLQVVRHFFVQNDMRAAINALRKLPDHAVHADVVSVLMEKMDSLTLDLFSDLLPVLLDLLASNTERHINVSLELLLKLVAVFGPVINSAVSAPPTVGVNLHAEKRLECCNKCHIQLLKIHKCLPDIISRGGLPARCAQELNVILQTS
ncbi:katanin p80 WD40 repeat-containing subunit B1 homolog KTN80.2-like [Rutidosis leptorrhynchoides]|uniref:katanin p80 WD40 repeat-containing subunit B1 homolog KTN80.2-like n=1 Tax=Rutidosis leptorrhynchoides TaxID=125765 RepID=UPI003A99AADF